MKIKILSVLAIMAFSFTTIAQTTCVVKTPCGDFTFNENVSVSSSQQNGVTRIVIRNNNGNVLSTRTCNRSGQISTSCSSSGGDGDTDICDFIPAFLKPFYDCN